MKIINLTGHPVTIVPHPSTQPNLRITIPPANLTARVTDSAYEHDELPFNDANVKVRSIRKPTEVEGIPQPKPNTYYIVSRITAISLALSQDRTEDIYFPLHILHKYNIDGCQRLGTYHSWEDENCAPIEIITEV